MQKITIAESDIRQALEGIECPPEKKEIFLQKKKTVWHELRYGRLDDIVSVLVEKGVVSDAISGIKHLLTEDFKIKKTPQKVSLSDLQNKSSNKALYKTLGKLRGIENPNHKGDPSRVFGVKSHVSIPALFSGDILKINKNGFRLNELAKQMDFGFLEEVEELKETLFPVDNIKPKSFYSKEISIDRKIKKIENNWKKVVVLMEKTRLPNQSKEYQVLLGLMKPIFKKDLEDILDLGKKSFDNSQLAFITVMSWVPALLRYFKDGSRVLFKEISMLPHRFDMGLGRIDALEVEMIGGKPPTFAHLKILKHLSQQEIKSVGHLIRDLIYHFGYNISIVIHDWKFCAGDGDNGINKTLNIIHTESILQKPLMKHLNQMRRYNSSTLISYAMVIDETVSSLEEAWEKNHFSISGKIHYFLPNIHPVVHEVVLTDEEKKEVFHEQVVQNYANGERISQINSIGRQWLKYAISIVQGSILAKQSMFNQLELDLGKNHNGKISELVKDAITKTWYDKLELVQYLGQDKKTEDPILRLDHNKFKKAVDNGAIAVSESYDHATGGHVTCFLPGHSHTGKGTPSFYVDPLRKFFKCYGSCGAWGHFLVDDDSDDYEEASLVSRRLIIKSFSDIEAFSVPERYSQAMQAAQRIFQDNFLESPGALYLINQRRLDPKLSMLIGAGFADSRSIERMLDLGFTYDELIEFGFIGISHRVKESNKMVGILKRRGLSLNQIQRSKLKTVNGVPVLLPGALPFIVLDNRLTYPLDVNHVITHFYGRSVDPNCPKDYAHQKTSPNPKVPQGGFNITKAMEKAIAKVKGKSGLIPELGITEAPIDVDTMFQRGDLKEFGAFVGVNNRLIFQILGCFPGVINIGLNWDESRVVDGIETLMAGQRNTVKIVKFLESVNFGFPVNDLTEPLANKIPEFNDFNRHWQKVWNNFWGTNPTGIKSSSFKNYLKPFDVLNNKKRIL